jgi:ParB family chromosome partitioning protein
MASAAPKLILSPSRDIPVQQAGAQSQSNVRRVKCRRLGRPTRRRASLSSTLAATASTSALVVDADGVETGMFEVPAGGRRYRALELLVKHQADGEDASRCPCVVREDGDVIGRGGFSRRETSSASRPAPARPVPRVCKILRGPGASSVDDIAARHFMTPAIVRQRLRLAIRVAEAARRLCRRWHDARAAHGLLRRRPTMRARSRSGT